MNTAVLQEWLQTGLRHHQAGHWDEAAKWYGKVRIARPRNFDALHLDGTRALQQGKYEDALKLLSQARRESPQSAVCTLRLGIAHFMLGRNGEAERQFREAARLDPKLAEASFHLGQTLRRLGQLDEAVAAFRHAIELQPNYAEAYDRLGALLWGLKGAGAAEPILRKAVELDSKLATAWCNLGLSWIHQGRLSDALTAIGKALELNPKFDHAFAARGLALSKFYRAAAAADAYGQALKLNPGNFEAHSARLLELQYDGSVSKAELFAAHRAFGEAVEARLPKPTSHNVAGGGDPGRPAFDTAIAGVGAPGYSGPPRRLRVGFLSPDLHRHSVAYYLRPILAHLDRSRFEVFLYNDMPSHDEVSDQLKALSDGWRSTAGMPVEALENVLREDRLDILIDLAGHTGHNRLPLYARRVAPVQATYLGYPDTTGLAAMDYRLVDSISDPPGSADGFATERLVRFSSTAWSYEPPAGSPDPAPGPAATNGHVTFGCFNNVAKLSDTVLRTWGKILAAVPEGRLLLKGYGLTTPALQAELNRRMVQAGIPRERVHFLERTADVADHLDLYRRVDVALDTFPYHGTTTTCEALWMGVPVVTQAGDRHASRVGASLLTALGRPEWIAENESDYIGTAIRLAGEASRSAGPRVELRERLRGSALMDHPGQAARLGAALESLLSPCPTVS
ncbi:MAG TPA: tetratricopeptide repeat protein [Opitutaceae bacterium]|jgi:predicted O-linked N-acetylglucosamine transferase (SPINDLY family)